MVNPKYKRNISEIEKTRQEQLSRDRKAMSRSIAMRSLLNSEVWKKYVLPYIEETIASWDSQCRFDPTKDIPSLERLGFLNSFNSGQITGVETILAEFISWVNIGEEAAKRITLSQKRAEAQREKKII